MNIGLARSIFNTPIVDTEKLIMAELGKITKDTGKAVLNLSSKEKTLYDHYVKYMENHVNFVEDACNVEIRKQAGNALEKFGEHLYAKTPEAKDYERAIKRGFVAPEQLQILEARKRLPLLEALHKVTALYQREVAEAKKALEPLGLQEVISKSDRVLRLAIERDKHYAQAEKLLEEAPENITPTMKKYLEKEYSRLTNMGNMIEETREIVAKDRLYAIEKYKARVEKAGKQKEYELIHGLPLYQNN